MSSPAASEQKPASTWGASKGSADRSVMRPRDLGRTTSSCAGVPMNGRQRLGRPSRDSDSQPHADRAAGQVQGRVITLATTVGFQRCRPPGEGDSANLP